MRGHRAVIDTAPESKTLIGGARHTRLRRQKQSCLAHLDLNHTAAVHNTAIIIAIVYPTSCRLMAYDRDSAACDYLLVQLEWCKAMLGKET